MALQKPKYNTVARKGYIIDDQQAIYYLTFTLVGWIDIFTRQVPGQRPPLRHEYEFPCCSPGPKIGIQGYY